MYKKKSKQIFPVKFTPSKNHTFHEIYKKTCYIEREAEDIIVYT